MAYSDKNYLEPMYGSPYTWAIIVDPGRLNDLRIDTYDRHLSFYTLCQMYLKNTRFDYGSGYKVPLELICSTRYVDYNKAGVDVYKIYNIFHEMLIIHVQNMKDHYGVEHQNMINVFMPHWKLMVPAYHAMKREEEIKRGKNYLTPTTGSINVGSAATSSDTTKVRAKDDDKLDIKLFKVNLIKLKQDE